MRQRDNISSSNSSMVQLIVFKQHSSEIWGEILNMYCEKPISCTDMGDFLLKLDALYEHLNYPMANMRVRSFSKQQKPVSHNAAPSAEPAACFDSNIFNIYQQLRKKEQHAESLSTHQKKHDKPVFEVFFINTIFRQHASWQGEVLWEKTGQKVCFRSALELLHLIQSALQKTKPNDDPCGATYGQTCYLRKEE